MASALSSVDQRALGARLMLLLDCGRAVPCKFAKPAGSKPGDPTGADLHLRPQTTKDSRS